MPNPIDTAWRNYAEIFVPLGTPDEDREALRRAFHTGAVEAVAALVRPVGRGGRHAAFITVTAELTRFMDGVAKS